MPELRARLPKPETTERPTRSSRTRQQANNNNRNDDDSSVKLDFAKRKGGLRSALADDEEQLLEDEAKEHSAAGQTSMALPGHHDGLKGDYGNVALLVFLYLLQGIPLGLTASIPLVLQSRHTSYAQQAIFSFAYWPFSLKLLWAPIVDACYWPRFGRRKSWMVPTQYLIGIFMIILSQHVTDFLGDDYSDAKVGAKATGNATDFSHESPTTAKGPNVYFLTAVFFAFNFLAATQDIAVDGWALTMLSEHNVGHASTCNAVGQTAGYFIGNVVFLALESAEFCNNYLRAVPRSYGLVTLSGFVYVWGWIFLITTTLVMLLKHERSTSHPSSKDSLDNLSVWSTYRLMWNIVRLWPVLQLVIIYLTTKIAFAAADGITGLKLIEKGVPKDKLAFLAIPMVPLQILLPWLIGSYVAGPRPLRIYLQAYPFRLFMGLIFALIVWWTPMWKLADGHFPNAYYALIVFLYMIHQVAMYSCFVATMAMNAKVSDPLVGGSYMTLLNTVSNLGSNWPVTLALSIVDYLTFKSCVKDDNVLADECPDEKVCLAKGGTCVTSTDGYYTLSIICALIGVVWLRLMWKRMDRLHDVPKKEWTCSAVRRHSLNVGRRLIT